MLFFSPFLSTRPSAKGTPPGPYNTSTGMRSTRGRCAGPRRRTTATTRPPERGKRGRRGRSGDHELRFEGCSKTKRIAWSGNPIEANWRIRADFTCVCTVLSFLARARNGDTHPTNTRNSNSLRGGGGGGEKPWSATGGTRPDPKRSGPRRSVAHKPTAYPHVSITLKSFPLPAP